jgi:hypothetical protein
VTYNPEAGSNEGSSAGDKAVVGAAIGAFAGGCLGLLAGTSTQSERWIDVPVSAVGRNLKMGVSRSGVIKLGTQLRW